MYRYLLSAGICGLLAVIGVCGQYVPNPDRQQAAERRKQQRETELNQRAINAAKQQNETDKTIKPRLNAAAAEAARKEIREERKKLETLRRPEAEDLIKYEDFLKQSRTGLFRLFNDLDCQTKNVVRVDGNCENAVLSSSAYSFRRKDYIESNFWDIRFKDGNLIADGFLAQEILLSLGDIPLENISLESSGIKFLSEYQAIPEILEAKRQYRELSQTISVGDYKYGKTAKAELNTTYVLRAAAFRNDRRKVARLSSYTLSSEDKPFWDLENDKRADVIIAFRIVRNDENSNITILWKELNRRDAPRIVFGEKEKMTDIK